GFWLIGTGVAFRLNRSVRGAPGDATNLYATPWHRDVELIETQRRGTKRDTFAGKRGQVSAGDCVLVLLTCATSAASRRLLTLSFLRMLWTWFFTVPSSMMRVSAISWLVRPSEMRSSTSCSRRVNS